MDPRFHFMLGLERPLRQKSGQQAQANGPQLQAGVCSTLHLETERLYLGQLVP